MTRGRHELRRRALGWGVASVLAGAAGCGESGVSAGRDGEPVALEVVKAFGEVGKSPGQFTYPRAIDGDGSALWVIDKAAHVQRIDPASGQATAAWFMPESTLGKPCGVTVFPPRPGMGVGSGQLLYVPDTHYFRVMVYRAGPEGAGELVSQFGGYGEGPGQFIYLTDVAILPAADGGVDRIYVSEYGGNDRISVFDRDEKFLFSFGEPGSGPGAEFNRPQSIALDAERGRLVVTDACNHRVGVFTLDGKLVRWIGSPEGTGRGWDEFAYPYGLALMDDGTALVSEFGNHRIHHVDVETGRTLGLYGKPGRGPGELTNPWGVAVMDGTVWVLDSGNGRVQGFKAPRAVKRSASGDSGGDRRSRAGSPALGEDAASRGDRGEGRG